MSTAEGKFITVQQQNERFSIDNKTTGVKLFKSHIRRTVIMHYNIADLWRGVKHRKCWDESTNQIVTATIRV